MASTSALIVIDGSHGEGGGALLRTALAMAALTQQAVRVDNVRAGTKFPGLDAEDLTMIKVLAACCRAELVGAEPASASIAFFPSTRPKGFSGEIEAIRNSSGRGPNILVVLNSLLPVLCRTGVFSTLSGTGETYGFNTLSYDYFAAVTLEALKKVGLYAATDLLVPGFGRDSEGEVILQVEPSALTGLEWPDRRSLREVRATVTTSNVPQAIADRAASHLKNLGQSAGLHIQISKNVVGGSRQGAFVTVWAVYERGMGGGTAMASRSIRPETIVQAAFQQVTQWMSTNATVDPFLADQLLLPLVLAEGTSVISVPRLTQRLLTSIWVVKQFTPIHITVRGIEDGPGSISVRRS